MPTTKTFTEGKGRFKELIRDCYNYKYNLTLLYFRYICQISIKFDFLSRRYLAAPNFKIHIRTCKYTTPLIGKLIFGKTSFLLHTESMGS